MLAAALQVFVERGFAAARLEDVAARAGVTKGTLYLYFENKEALLTAVVRTALVPIVREAEVAVEHFEGHTGDLLRSLVASWWQSVGSQPLSGIPKLVIAEAGNFPAVARLYHDEVIRPTQELIGRLLQRGIERGEFRPVDGPYAERLVMAPLVMLNLWTHSFARDADSSLDPQRYLTAYLDLLLAGLEQRPACGDTNAKY